MRQTMEIADTPIADRIKHSRRDMVGIAHHKVNYALRRVHDADSKDERDIWFRRAALLLDWFTTLMVVQPGVTQES